MSLMRGVMMDKLTEPLSTGKKKKRFSVLLLVSSALVALILVHSGARWAFRSFMEGRVSMTYEAHSEAVENPFMGYVNHADNPTQRNGNQLVFARVSWSDLEPEEGQFDFEYLEEYYEFDLWRGRGSQLILLFHMDWPDSTLTGIDIPDWLYEKINGDGTYYLSRDGLTGGFSPNYRNPILQEYHRKALEAIAEYFRDDPFLWMMKMGSIGHWGEMHTTYIQDLSEPGVMPSESTAVIYEQAYADLFGDRHVSSRYPRQVALDNHFGLHNDSFGNPQHTYDWFIDWFQKGYTNLLTKDQHPAMPNFWKVAPSGGEFPNYPGTMWLADEKIEDTVNQARESHVTWLMEISPGAVAKDTDAKKNLTRLLSNMGYRLHVSSADFATQWFTGVPLDVHVTLTNSGVAPLYENWPLQLALLDEKGFVVHSEMIDYDLTELLPGSVKLRHIVKVPAEVEAGTYELAIAIISPETNLPGIQMTNVSSLESKRVPLGEIQLFRDSWFIKALR